MTNKQVTVISVTYNSAPVIGTLINSIPDGTPVLVIDNASTDNTVAIAENLGAKVVQMPKNVGFGVGCNAGAEHARTPYLFFANPDSVLDPHTLEHLLSAANRLPDASAFNPLILSESGKPAMKRRSLIVPRSRWLCTSDFDVERQIPTLSGAAIFCSKNAFDKIGGFDPDIFLFHEDDDIASRFEAEVGPLYFIPDSVVMHNAGHSSARSVTVAAIKGYAMGQSRVHVLRKHGCSYAYVKSLARALLQLISPTTLISKRRRAKAVAIFKGVQSVR